MNHPNNPHGNRFVRKTNKVTTTKQILAQIDRALPRDYYEGRKTRTTQYKLGVGSIWECRLFHIKDVFDSQVRQRVEGTPYDAHVHVNRLDNAFKSLRHQLLDVISDHGVYDLDSNLVQVTITSGKFGEVLSVTIQVHLDSAGNAVVPSPSDYTPPVFAEKAKTDTDPLLDDDEHDGPAFLVTPKEITSLEGLTAKQRLLKLRVGHIVSYRTNGLNGPKRIGFVREVNGVKGPINLPQQAVQILDKNRRRTWVSALAVVCIYGDLTKALAKF